MRTKDTTIEALRGLACLLIVGFHALPVTDAGMGSIDYAYLGHCFRLIRLPLFTAISGYVYAMYPVSTEYFGRFVSGKARRILLPWVSVTILTLVLKSALQPDGAAWIYRFINSLWFPIDHLWFLPAIFWVILTVAILETLGFLRSFQHWVLVCILAWVPAIFFMVIPSLGITGFFQLLPFFLFGLGLYRFHALLNSAAALAGFAVTAVVGLLVHQLIWFGVVSLSDIQYNLLVLVTVYGTQGIIFEYRRNIPALAFIGQYSFSIYLFHLIAISIATRLEKMVGIENIHWGFAIKLMVGLLLPIVAALVLRRSIWLNLLFFGVRRPIHAWLPQTGFPPSNVKL